MAASSGTSGPTFSPIVKYVLLVVLAVAALVASYWLQLVPDTVGFAGAGVSIVGLFTFAVADLETNGDPASLPKGTTFVVVTVLAALLAAVGVFTSQTLATTAAFLVWLLVVLEYLLTTFRAHLDQYVPSAYDSWIVAGVGIAVAVVAYIAANPTASLQSAVITGIVTLASFINNSGAPAPVPVPAPSSSGAPTPP